jgi:hypothetical protein
MFAQIPGEWNGRRIGALIMDGETLDGLAEVLARTDAQRETLRMLKERTLTETEIRDLIANTEGIPNAVRVRAAIYEAVNVAKREGRYRDDTVAIAAMLCAEQRKRN